jgi:integrase
MARRTLSDKGVQALKPRLKRYAYPDPQLACHYVRVTPNAVKTYCVVTRDPNGTQRWVTTGRCDAVGIADARIRARDILSRVRAGKPPIEPRAETFAAVAANWIKRHVEPNGLRSAREVIRLLNRHILPKWKDREFISLRRSDVAALLDHIEDNVSARQADACLTIVRSIGNWFAIRNDNYQPPFIRGMRRQSPHAQARARVLSDDELRKIWIAAETSGAFGAVVQLALLTAQRREKIVSMRWSELSEDCGEWSISKAPREKENAGVLLLPPIAQAIIAKRPRLNSDYVFVGRADNPISGFSQCKRRLDEASGVTGWRLHDLRRTARSLMSRAGVLSEHAERVMGHTIAGVESIYDRFEYRNEKRDALRKLAALIKSIIDPLEGQNVLQLTKRKRR